MCVRYLRLEIYPEYISDDRNGESDITYKDIEECTETVPVNRVALQKLKNDEHRFRKRGNVHQRMAIRKLFEPLDEESP